MQMSSNKKFFYIIVLTFLVVGVVNSAIFIFSFKNFSLKTAINQGISLANSIRDGLTAKMLDGTISERDEFLNTVISHQKISNFHLFRAPNVVNQFGKGTSLENRANSIERKVLSTKKIKVKLIDSFEKTILKIAIPYVASSVDKPNCMQCHNAKEGEILGIISMDFDITEVKWKSIEIIGKILFVTFAIMIITLLIANSYLKPYMRVFEDIEIAIQKAYKGNFSSKIVTNIKGEIGKVARMLNQLIEIYRFKKTIELDEDKYIIYDRIVYILQKKFKIYNFILFEIKQKSKNREIIFNSTDSDKLETNVDVCRAFRTSGDVFSADFDNICLKCNQKTKYFICLDFKIDENFSLVFHLQMKNESEYFELQNNLQAIRNYIEIAKPVIESKILLSVLKDTSLKDPLTSLYNRRFLNELLESNIPARVKEGYVHSVLMMDIDFFKKVNDKYGHNIGDEVIKMVAYVIKKHIRNSDIAVRYGGEEFLVLLINATSEKTIEIAKKISKDFSEAIFVSGKDTFKKTISTGICYYPTDANKLWKAIKLADEALYKAKNNGRNRIFEINGKEYLIEENS
jgi:diguanylate cyclase (GGDEF)-like protein